MDKNVQADLFRAAGEVSRGALLRRLSKDRCFRYLYFLRMAKGTPKRSPLRVFYYLCYKHYGVKYGMQIPLSVSIGPGLSLPHEGGIVVNTTCKIGSNVTLLHGVTLGNVREGKYKGSPEIGSYVYIGPGAVIVGNIKIGDRALIAPNSYVNRDVPEGSVVIGNPSTIIAKENASSGYIINPWERDPA